MFLSGLIGNMDHNVADVMELVWVAITIVITLALLVWAGKWWQR